MITVKNKRVMELDGVYIKDGILLKYRWYNDDVSHEDNYLHHKARDHQEITSEDFMMLNNKTNIVVEDKGTLSFYNMDEDRLKIMEDLIKRGH